MKSANKIETVDEYIACFQPKTQAILKKIRHIIKKSAPQANELISYGMPFYEYGGGGIQGRLLYFAAFTKHISLFIIPRDNKTIPQEMKQFHISKATYQFPLNKPFPFNILETTVKLLVNERK
jgi:uncharacterized protein YdhG (YjbR/CyaY superfamily)